MIRYTFIQNKVLEIYQSLPELKFPIDIQQVINTIPNCRLMTYQTFSEINDCSIDDVIPYVKVLPAVPISIYFRTDT